VNDIYLGNGVSELIVMVTQALAKHRRRDPDPRTRLPAVDRRHYAGGRHAGSLPLRRAVRLVPDLADIRSRITDRTRAILVINPNNPTGSVYPREILEGIVAIAIEHGLVILADEIYDKILYDGARHTALASISTSRSASPSTGCRRPTASRAFAPAG